MMSSTTTEVAVGGMSSRALWFIEYEVPVQMYMRFTLYQVFGGPMQEWSHDTLRLVLDSLDSRMLPGAIIMSRRGITEQKIMAYTYTLFVVRSKCCT